MLCAHAVLRPPNILSKASSRSSLVTVVVTGTFLFLVKLPGLCEYGGGSEST
jgi:hypothetical protein